MHKYNHLNLEERERIYAFREKGLSLRKIAKCLRRDISTISREISRHTKYGKEYIPCYAHREALRMGMRQRRKSALKNPLVFLYVRKHLRPPFSWSPETIAGRLSIDHPKESICHETIYRYIYLNSNTRREKLWEYLHLHRKKRMKKHGRKVRNYTRFSEAISVPERPSIINKRLEAGHWETDNMEGKKSDKTSVSVTVERVTRKAKFGKLKDHKSKTKTDIVVNQLTKEDDGFVKSITFDRGPENSGYREIASTLNIVPYACTPYRSWEKGSVENMIKRLRRYVPKGTSVDSVSQQFLTLIENKFNDTPRKCLEFLTPNEFQEKMLTASNQNTTS